MILRIDDVIASSGQRGGVNSRRGLPGYVEGLEW